MRRQAGRVGGRWLRSCGDAAAAAAETADPAASRAVEDAIRSLQRSSEGDSREAALIRVTRRMIAHPSLLVCATPDGRFIPFPEQHGEGRTSMLVLSFTSAEQHRGLVESVQKDKGDKSEALQRMLSSVQVIGGSHLVSMVSMMLMRDVMQAVEDGVPADEAAEKEQPGGVRINGVPVIMGSMYVRCAMTAFSLRQMMAVAARGPGVLREDELQLKGAQCKESAAARLNEQVFFIVTVDSGADSKLPTIALVPLDDYAKQEEAEREPLAEGDLRNALLPVFSDPQSAWLFQTYLADTKPSANAQVRKAPAETVWGVAAQMCAPGGARGVVLNPLPPTEPEGDGPPLVVWRSELWWVFKKTGAAAA